MGIEMTPNCHHHKTVACGSLKFKNNNRQVVSSGKFWDSLNIIVYACEFRKRYKEQLKRVNGMISFVNLHLNKPVINATMVLYWLVPECTQILISSKSTCRISRKQPEFK